VPLTYLAIRCTPRVSDSCVSGGEGGFLTVSENGLFELEWIVHFTISIYGYKYWSDSRGIIINLFINNILVLLILLTLILLLQ
jgi:hypothetical protein